jgi:single-stranded DNA-binding protein
MSQKVILTNGRLGKGGAEIMTSKGGTKYLNFSLACTTKNGQDETTTWYDCVGFDERFLKENLVKYLTQGAALNVVGNLSASAQLSENKDRAFLNLRVVLMDLEFAGSRPKEEGETTTNRPAAQTASTPTAADIPPTVPEPADNGEDDIPF